MGTAAAEQDKRTRIPRGRKNAIKGKLCMTYSPFFPPASCGIMRHFASHK
jgi:hypothetical protein